MSQAANNGNAQEEMRKWLEDPVAYERLWSGRRVDWFLQQLVSMANGEPSLEIGVTLTTPAGLISGTIISARKYFKEFGELFAAGTGGSSELANMFAAQGEQPADGEVAFQFLHLKNAVQLSAAGTVPTHEGTLWRGKIADVAGFSIGAIEDR